MPDNPNALFLMPDNPNALFLMPLHALGLRS